MKPFDSDLVSGSILRSVWKLAWPAILLSLVNGLHSWVDHMLAGHYLGYQANAGIGAAWQMYLVMFVFMSSLFQGMSVLVARHAGRQDREMLSRVAYHTFLASLYLLVFVAAPVGYFLAPVLLDLVHAAPDVQAHGLPYLRVMFTCSAPLFLMILVTIAFQASGDLKTPLALGVMTTALHVLFSYTLITGAGPFPRMGAAGAALASSFSPVAGLLAALGLVLRGRTIIGMPARLTLVPDPRILRAVFRIGLPTGTQTVLLNVGGVILMAKVGTLADSAAAQAAYVVCYSQLFSLVTWASMGIRVAASTAMGQNLGARQPGRAGSGVQVAVAMGVAWAIAIGLLFHLAAVQLLALFSNAHEPVLGYGISLLRYLSVSGVFLSATMALTGGLQGAGDTRSPMYIALATQIGILLGAVELQQWTTGLTADSIWRAILLSHFSRLLLTAAVFQRGRWRAIDLDLGH